SRLGAGARLVQGDMRHLPFARPFAGVLSFFTSFGYFMSEGDNVRVLREIARVLTPGGKLLLDLADRRSVVEGLVPQSSRREGELTIEERRWISSSGDRVEKEVRLLESGEERRLYESVRLYDLDEVCEALRGAGLRCLRTYGDFSGSPYPCEEGGRMVVVAERISD
ncbi:MAG: class I SAM-dependent methyltransferase, partial [Planctomycetota bacterium]